VPRKTSLYVDEQSEAIVAARDVAPQAARRHGRRSLLFREVLRRYDAICRTDLPSLGATDWSVLLPVGANWVHEAVGVSARLGSLFGAAHSAGREDLIRRLMGLGGGQSTALIDFIERYWAAKARGEEPPSIPAFPAAAAEASA
jgi:hypothetical protein